MNGHKILFIKNFHQYAIVINNDVSSISFGKMTLLTLLPNIIRLSFFCAHKVTVAWLPIFI